MIYEEAGSGVYHKAPPLFQRLLERQGQGAQRPCAMC